MAVTRGFPDGVRGIIGFRPDSTTRADSALAVLALWQPLGSGQDGAGQAA
jgi:hypothetical protein